MKKKDFFRDDQCQWGVRYFIDADRVNEAEFNRRRERECAHRDNGRGICMDCRMRLVAEHTRRSKKAWHRQWHSVREGF